MAGDRKVAESRGGILVDVTHIGVIGAGTMGRGIAYAAAVSGYSVAVFDVNEAQLVRARDGVEADFVEGVHRGKLSEEDSQRALSRIRWCTDIVDAVHLADLVVEAVIEQMDVKTSLFQQLDTICPTHTILATNTSTMSPTEIGAVTKRPEKTLAMHFFNPVPKMKLVEIVRGLDTSDETYQTVRTVASKMGKESVEVNEFPGFVTSRMNCLIGNEAMTMLQEGVASAEDIDKALRLGLNFPMGPLALADLVGLDTRLRNMQILYEKLGEKYRPAPILEKYVKAGRLGRKSGIGFYRYDQ